MQHPAGTGTMLIALLGWLAAVLAGAQAPGETMRAHRAIAYDSRPARDAVAELQRRVAAGQIRLTSSGPSGYLRSILDALDVPVSSQVTVFSKGSLQSRLIEAGNPRALYFNDEVSVGWVRGGFMEIAAQDPEQGTMFYIAGTARTGSVSIERADAACLRCHESPLTLDVPGRRLSTDHRTPIEERWGGWYVTGRLDEVRHFGNVDVARMARAAPPASAHDWRSLDGRFDWSGYLTPYSDAVALMVFEHQLRAINMLTRIGWETRLAEAERRTDGAALLRQRAEELVDYLLFVDEADIPAPIRSTSGFAEAFSARGPADGKGRSLRQFDLSTRLMRYPCSYMVYSRQFDALPAAAKTAVYERLWTVLSGAAPDAKYTRLSAADRRAIAEILLETKKDLPRYFSPAAVRP